MSRRLVTCALLVCLVLCGRAAAEQPTGEQLYARHCADCHGAKGEGTSEIAPLAGDKPVSELARFIDKTMPKDEPETLNAEESQLVAAYIYDAFYSPMAQVRNAPARVELSRLTVRQYRHVLADLVGSFRNRAPWQHVGGLDAEYYKSRRFRREDRQIERVDATVNFQFGEGTPGDGFGKEEFSGRWNGSFLAPETGEYEFIVKTDNGARLWINDTRTPLIDAWVKSGNDTEYRQSIWLLGGRAYPVRLEWSKSKEKSASIGLWWKVPGRQEEVVPARYLSRQRFPSSFVATTPFPPDDRSVGYERGTSVSKAWDAATTDGAIETAAYIEQHLEELSRVKADARDRADRLREFCHKFAERAFRRPLSDLERELYVDRQFAGMDDPAVAVKRSVLLVLKSPRFLYQNLEDEVVDGYDIAARLSFALWDSLPDDELLSAAREGRLATREQVVAQAERMAKDIRAQAKLREFLAQWLKLDHIQELSKDPQQFADFNPQIASDLRTSLDLMIDEVITSDAADFRTLLTGDELFLNGRLAKFYGAELPEEADFQKVKLEPDARAGVLTHPYLLAGFAYTSTSSPIHRGVFIARSVLGRSLRPPPEAVSPLAPDLHPDLTTRERVILQTQAEMCMSCHNLINPLGFTLEHFDAVGRYRKEEKGKPIDASGSYLARTGEEAKFAGVRDLARYLADSPETHTALSEQLFHYLIKQPINAFGPEASPRLTKRFTEEQFNLRKLMVEIAAFAALEMPPRKP